MSKRCLFRPSALIHGGIIKGLMIEADSTAFDQRPYKRIAYIISPLKMKDSYVESASTE